MIRWYIAPQLRMWEVETGRALTSQTAAGRGGTGLSCYFCEEDFLALLKQYLSSLLQPMIGNLKDGEIFVEKSPSHALCIPEIKRLLPDSRIIHILRDPRDVVASLLAASRSWGAAWAPRKSAEASALWVEHVRSVRLAARKLSAEDFCEIRYEELSRAPEKTIERVARFLDLAWSASEIYKAVEDNRPGAIGTSIPLYGEVGRRIGPVVIEPDGFVRRARVGAWRSDLSIIQQATVWRVCRTLMKEVGYDWFA